MEPPVIDLLGPNPMHVDQCEEFFDPRVFVNDNVDSAPDLLANVNIGGWNLYDTSTPGTFTIIYDVQGIVDIR